MAACIENGAPQYAWCEGSTPERTERMEQRRVALQDELHVTATMQAQPSEDGAGDAGHAGQWCGCDPVFIYWR